MNREDWHTLLFLMLSHNLPENLDRTIRLEFRGRSVHFCARCTGVYSGILIVLISSSWGFNFPTWMYLPLFSILPIPAAVDWITQSFGLRDSRNSIRISTGCFFGVSQGLFLLMLVNAMFYLFLQALVVVAIYLLLVYVCARVWKTKFFASRKAELLRYEKS